MSLPSQTVAFLQAARDLVKGLPADAVLLLPETSLDWEEVGRLLGGCRLFVAAENPALVRDLVDNPDWTVIDLDGEPVPTQERMNNALLKAVTTGDLQPGAHAVVLYNGIATVEDAPEPVDSLSIIHLGEHLERMTPQDLRVLGRNVPGSSPCSRSSRAQISTCRSSTAASRAYRSLFFGSVSAPARRR